MICPNCARRDRSVILPQITSEKKFLKKCKFCGYEVYLIPPKTAMYPETSREHTVRDGEAKEEELMNIYLRYYEGDYHKKREKYADIDRKVCDAEGNVLYYMEVKNRSNSINAFKETAFPFRKVISAKELITKTGKSVYILLKFADCWTRHRFRLNKRYKKTDVKMRRSDRESEGQYWALLDVEEDLEILSRICNPSYSMIVALKKKMKKSGWVR